MIKPAPQVANSTALGIFGGTFDPIHLGHTTTVRELITLSGLNQVRFIPAATPPHRDRPVVAARHRLAMVEIAIAEQPDLCVDERELYRFGPSYTVDTIESILAEVGDRPLCLILGLDAVLGLDRWHRWQSLLEMAGLLVMVRPGYTVPEPLPDWWQMQAAEQITNQLPVQTGNIRLLPITPSTISATHIRNTIQRGGDPGKLLHPGVWQYIQSHHLYD